jgi:uncharacterized protein (UPF0264 family)
VGRLLVSVRSAAEARDAAAGGASIIDVKEPNHGSLGRALCSVWTDVRRAVPSSIPVSVALGELTEWDRNSHPLNEPDLSDINSPWTGISFAKMGLSRAPNDWRRRLLDLATQLTEAGATECSWVAVAYVDWQLANAPDPDEVIEFASSFDGCQGVLFDTYDKSATATIDPRWRSRIERVRSSGRFVAIAGSLDISRIEQLADLRPDIWAVRSSACTAGNRLGPIDPERVARLAEVARQVPVGC